MKVIKIKDKKAIVEIEVNLPTNCKDCIFGNFKGSFLGKEYVDIKCDFLDNLFKMEFYDSCTNRYNKCPFGSTNKKVYGNPYK